MQRRWTGVALTGPAIAALALTALFPLLWTISLSMQDFQVGVNAPASSFVGGDNYVEVLTSPEFVQALFQTLGYVATTLVLELVIGLPIALALQRATMGRRLLRVVVALPLMVAPVVASLAFKFLFSNDYGLINQGLAVLGLPTPSWFADVWLARTTILVSNLWLALPFVVLVLLAALANIPDELIEAARTDGAGRWRTFVHIILPLLRPAILIILVIRLADAFRIFDAVYVLTGGGPGNATEVMSSFLYRMMFTRADFPGAAAATVLFVVVIAVCAGSIFFILRDREARR
ncbi:carbohydrate ABC transporter permease [Agromyces sp. ZXT2-6]|uniref:carbohydrate ABC transporter permease n=1 Tax=Agromyces sp. ZXT2-6 TaxID=3461153 RepID=UPI004054B48A